MFKKTTLLTCITGFLLLVGCNKLTQENYNKLHIDMERAQVEALFGKPDQCQNILSATNCSWSKDSASLQIQFINNKVVTYFANNIK